MGQGVLITGGAGFIGLALANRLNQAGYRVRVLDRMVHNKRLQCNWASGFETLIGDVCDAPTMATAVQHCSYVVHLASLAGISQIRAWCYIDDFIEGLASVLISDGTIGQIYNLGNPSQALPTHDLARLVVQVCDSSSPIIVQPAREADVHIGLPQIDKAQNELSFRPKVTLAEGIGIMRTRLSQSQDLRCNSI